MAKLDQAPPTGVRGSRRRAALWAISVGITVVSCALLFGLVGVAFYARQEGGLFYAAKRESITGDPQARPSAITVFHPYYTFSIRPDVPFSRFWQPQHARAFLEGVADPSRPPSWTKLRANNLGFYSEWDYPLHEPEAFLVGIFGGSVAHSFALQGGERLASQLSALPPLGGRPVRTLDFGSGGSKQPQQLFILAYLLHLEQRFDFVINLDGFNEVALGGLNVKEGLDTSMPSAIHLRSLSVLASSPNDIKALRYRVALDDLDVQDRALAERQAETDSAGLWMLAELRRRRVIQERRRLAASSPPVGGSSPLVAWTPPFKGEAED